MPIRVNMPVLMRLFFGQHSWLPLMTGHPFWEATFDQHLGWLLVRGFTVLKFSQFLQLTISQHWLSNGLVLNRHQAITGTNVDLDPCHIGSLGANRLRSPCRCKDRYGENPAPLQIPAATWDNLVIKIIEFSCVMRTLITRNHHA